MVMPVWTSVVVAVLCVAAPGQVQLRAVAETDLDVAAGARTDRRSPGTPIPDGFRLNVADSTALPECRASAGLTYLEWSDGAGRVGLRLRVSATHTRAANGCAIAGGRADGTIRLGWTATTPIRGRLLVTSSQVTATTRYVVDVGADGTVEAAAGGATDPSGPPANLSVPVDVGTGSFDVLVGLVAAADATPPSIVDRYVFVDVAFEPDPARVDVLGTPCGAALVGAWGAAPSGRALVLRAQAGAIRAAPFVLVGTRPAGLVVPPTGCPIRVDVVAAAPLALNTFGSGSMPVTVPPDLWAFDLRFQFVVGELGAGSGARWHTSEALRVRLP